ncbi:MAG: hypothetical protein Q7T18_06205, partial [Sedimentisphaerales bacterium]|nr:hypothetical protein [Sedimentisphaerales bacterium]
DSYHTEMQPTATATGAVDPKRAPYLHKNVTNLNGNSYLDFVYNGDIPKQSWLFQTNNLSPSFDPTNIGAGSEFTAFAVYMPWAADSGPYFGAYNTLFAKRGAGSCVYDWAINAGVGLGQFYYLTYADPLFTWAGNNGMKAAVSHISCFRIAGSQTVKAYFYDKAIAGMNLPMVETPLSDQVIIGRNASTTEPFGIAAHAQPCCGLGEGWGGYMSEIMIFARSVVGDERTMIENYLTNKYFGPKNHVPTACGDVNTNYLTGDFNSDCKVNFKDFAVMAQSWIKCTDPLNAGCDAYWTHP